MLPSMLEVVLGEMRVAIRGTCAEIGRERREGLKKAREEVEVSEERSDEPAEDKRRDREEGVGRSGRGKAEIENT